MEEVRGKLQDALNKLPQVSVPKDELEIVAENAARTVNTLHGEYIIAWSAVEKQIVEICKLSGVINNNSPPPPTIMLVDHLVRAGSIENEIAQRLRLLRNVRNHLAHGDFARFGAAELESYILELEDIKKKLDLPEKG